jgi:putative phosphoesterase
MNKITIFSDVHANLPALQAVLHDMDQRSLTDLYCLGDLVGYGTFPNEVIQIMREQQIPTIMGNYDQGVGNDSDDCGCAYTDPVSEALGKRSIAWSNLYTTPENKAFLRSLVPEIRLNMGNLCVVLVHGSPRKINEYLFENRPDASLERLMDTAGADVLVCGHTHLPYHRVLPSGRHIINDGSVGKPKDGDPRACYINLNIESDHLDVEFIRVAYDVERAAEEIEASEMPHEYAKMLRAGAG